MSFISLFANTCWRYTYIICPLRPGPLSRFDEIELRASYDAQVVSVVCVIDCGPAREERVRGRVSWEGSGRSENVSVTGWFGIGCLMLIGDVGRKGG